MDAAEHTPGMFVADARHHADKPSPEPRPERGAPGMRWQQRHSEGPGPTPQPVGSGAPGHPSTRRTASRTRPDPGLLTAPWQAAEPLNDSRLVTS
jgi:hypothetical protein